MVWPIIYCPIIVHLVEVQFSGNGPFNHRDPRLFDSQRVQIAQTITSKYLT